MKTRQTKYSGNSFWSDMIYHTTDLAATNLSAAETYTEDTPLNLTNIVVTGRGTVTVTLTLSNTSAGSLNTGTSGSVTSTFSGGVWTASGAVADVNTLLAALTFTPTTNFNSSFTIAVNVDNGEIPLTGVKAVTGVAVNDSPTATNLSAAETYTQDTPLNLVDIVISDVDSSTVTATLTLSNPSAGSLNTGTSGPVTSTYNGTTGIWSASGPIANVNTLLAGLIFTPASLYHSNFTISTSVSDGTASITGTKNMTGVAVNSAPVLDATRSPILPTIAQNSPAPSGAVGTVITGYLVDPVVPTGGLDNVTDVDGDSIGVAITAADTTNGTWFYSTNNGATWSALGVVSNTSARLLGPTARIYFQPNASFTGTINPAITFRAWDQSSGSNGALASTASTGGTTAFSVATDTASITVS